MTIGKMSLSWINAKYSFLLKYPFILLGLFFLFGHSTVLYKTYLFQDTVGDNHLLLEAMGKTKHLEKYAESYDLLFLGSSKTYIGIDPSAVDDVLGIKSFNYGSMAHWFPTQYVQFKNIIPYVKNKTVVWTISHEMFQGSNNRQARIMNDDMNRNFYLDLFDYFEYLSIGFDNGDLFDNLLLKYFHHNFLFFVKDSIQEKLRAVLDKKLFPSISTKKQSVTNISTHLDTYNDYFQYRLMNVKDMPDAMLYLYHNNGYLACVELQPQYLRTLQQFPQEEQDLFLVDPRKEALFLKALKLFQSNNVQLIVNIYWDAPYAYKMKDKGALEKYMSSIQTKVIQKGFTVINKDMELQNSDFFDSNHLNAKAAKKYSKQLAQELRNVI